MAPSKFLQHHHGASCGVGCQEARGQPCLLGLNDASPRNATTCHNIQHSSRAKTPSSHEHSPSPEPVTFARRRGISARAGWSLLATPRLLPRRVSHWCSPTWLTPCCLRSLWHSISSHNVRTSPFWCLGLCFRTLQLKKQPRCLLHIVSLIKGENVLCCCSLQAQEERNIRRLHGRPPAVSRSDAAGEKEMLQQRQWLDQTQITRGTKGLTQTAVEPAINTCFSLFFIKLIFQWLLETVKLAFSPC